ncbi:Na/Pi symporter [Tissierella sp. MB52-C2]|uniref:Na/Pi cotransporter family protein n=1 Tax=Tissierella sp. MB52-C2 TaxID=3070999 RepID=UPI00280AA310|nr:Na/Pi symporter [Tissierella sp. MB52-C2]WMM25024.1 Na/Pi symporter [Tissierella sp. MB52-C2]
MIELIFGLIGGTALLMYGVDMMSDGIQKSAGKTMKKVLGTLTGNVWSAFLVGTILTSIVQSSTAITVLTVGFVNSGVLNLSQAVGIIYGANIGTTVSAQLMAFSFKFKLTDMALPILGIGFAINQYVKNKNIKNLGQSLMGFGMLFLGLKILNDGIPYMENNEFLKYFFTDYAANPIIGILLGILTTAMVHSSTGTIGLGMILGQAGLLDLQTAIYIMLGDNIGTCITAQVSSLTGNINARRTAWAHTLYNIVGVIVALIMLPLFMKIIVGVTEYFQPNADISAYIANSHSLFNILNAIIFLPFTKYYVEFLNRIIRPKGKIYKSKTS